MLRDSVEIAAYGFAALVAVPCVLCLLARLFRCVGRSPLWRQCRAVILALLAAATIATIKAQKRTGTTGVPPVAGGTTGTTGVSPVANPITNTLYISAIAVSSNDTVTLTAAWPENFLTADQTLDVLGKENLHNETWTWLTNGVITTSATNISWTLENQSPSNHFYKVVVRESLTDMDDPDGDGLPNVYELARGRNPWVHDYALVQKLIVGTNDTYTTISTALAASTPYSVIEIAPGMYSGMGWSGVTLPEHPVLITGTGKRPVIRGDSFATFLLPSNSTEQTLLRNLSIDLGGRGGLRAGFWCGGNLPWSGQTASATFDNIYVRMPDSDAQYYGWIFYRSSTNRAVLSRCAVNAAGARDAVGVFAIDPPPISVENCTFANFPSNAPGYRGAALLLKTTVQNFGCVSNEVEVSVTGSVFDDSFTDALPLARFEEGTNFLVRMQDCALPHALEAPYLPDYSSSLWVTNGQTAWSGHALVDSLVADLGLGALPILENDPSTDSDGDGLSDYEEVYERGTDPFLVDSDNDGVTDGKEKDDGTDPTNPYSFTQRLLVTVTNTASTAYAVYTAWGGLERVWEANEQVMFPQGFGDTPYTNASPHGATHVKAFCDLNGNGEYDANADILLMRAIPYGSTAQIKFTFGDVDGDGFSDAFERSEGTDPCDGGSYCFNLSLTYTDVYQTTNALTFAGFWGTNCVYGPCVVDVRTWSHDFGHLQAVNGEKVFVSVWDDANQNGEWDVGETSNRFEIAVTSHDMIVTNDLPYGNFDHNHNTLPDWWEAQEGLSAEGMTDRLQDDPDVDGLINLHEFWSGTHPLTPDGSNTLLSVVARATDDRIYDISATNSLCLFDNYFMNGSNGVFQINTNFWAKDVDFSGVCVWNSSARHNERAGALISPRHLLMSNHGYPTSTNEVLYFRGKSGCIYSRRPVGWRGVSVPTSVSSHPDTGVVLLNAPLDTNDVSVISIFSTNLLSKIGNGYAVPFIYFNRRKEALIKEIRALTSGAGNPNWHHISFMRPLVTVRQPFVTDVLGIPGDSSSPSFILIDNKLVVLGVHSQTTSDSPVFLFTQQIQQAMDVLASGYELIIEDLSGYPDINR